MVGTEQELRRWSVREMKKSGHRLQHVAVNIGNGYQVRFVKEFEPKKRDKDASESSGSSSTMGEG